MLFFDEILNVIN